MKTRKNVSTATRAVLVLAEIKAAIAAFDRGEVNAFDALDTVAVTLESLQGQGQRGRPPRPPAKRPPAAA